MNSYELLAIIDPEGEEEAVVGVINEVISEHEVEVAKTDRWGLRTLSYPINKKGQGRYILFSLSTDVPEKMKELNDELRINEDIMRFSIVKQDK